MDFLGPTYVPVPIIEIYHLERGSRGSQASFYGCRATPSQRAGSDDPRIAQRFRLNTPSHQHHGLLERSV